MKDPTEINVRLDASIGLGWLGFWLMLGLLAVAGVKWWA